LVSSSYPILIGDLGVMELRRKDGIIIIGLGSYLLVSGLIGDGLFISGTVRIWTGIFIVAVGVYRWWSMERK